MAIDKVKFRKPVVPGDLLRLEVTPLRKGGAIWKMRGEAKVDGRRGRRGRADGVHSTARQRQRVKAGE